MSEKCNGNGTCLVQMWDEDENESWEYEGGKECPHKCKPIPCKFALLCSNARPQHLIDNHNGYCMDCDMFLRKRLMLINKDEEKKTCPTCCRLAPVKNVQQIQFLECGHGFCAMCVRFMMQWHADAFCNIGIAVVEHSKLIQFLPGHDKCQVCFPNPITLHRLVSQEETKE